jgi:hypothetical protein
VRLTHKLLVAPGTAIFLLLVFGAVTIHAMRTEDIVKGKTALVTGA